MTGRRKLRKRASQANNKDSEDTPAKKIKVEDLEHHEEPSEETTQTKHPIVAPNGKIFYPCQYCSKIFPHKTTSITHMKKCPSKNPSKQVALEENASTLSKNPNINNNSVDSSMESEFREVNGANPTPIPAPPKIRISQNITVKEAQPDPKLLIDPASVYNFDEEDDYDTPSKENDEDGSNSRKCKHCKTIFDNPLDLLRHTRDSHNFPRTILPPDEIEKYFDSPNRDLCPICEKPIKTRNFRSVFIKHLLIHTTGLTHECKVCKKKFRRRDHMRAHEKRHIVSV